MNDTDCLHSYQSLQKIFSSC